MPETFNGLLAGHYIRVQAVLYLFGNCEPFFLYVPIIPSINLLRNEEAKNAQLYIKDNYDFKQNRRHGQEQMEEGGRGAGGKLNRGCYLDGGDLLPVEQPRNLNSSAAAVLFR